MAWFKRTKQTPSPPVVFDTPGGFLGLEDGELVPAGGLVPIRRGGERRSVVPKPRPVPSDQETHGKLYGRDQVMKAVREQLAGSSLVELSGPAHIGKTTLAEHLVKKRMGTYDDHGSVFVDARGRTTRELSLKVFEHFFETAPPKRGYEPAELGKYLKPLQALVVIDNADVPDVDLVELRRALRDSHLLSVSQRRRVVPGAGAFRMPELELEDALLVLADIVGDAAVRAARPHAERLCAALGCYPGRLRLAAALWKDGDEHDRLLRLWEVEVDEEALAAENWKRLDVQQKAIVALLAVVGPAPLSAEAVVEITGIPDSRRILEQLEKDGQLRRHSPTFGLSSSVPEVILERLDEQPSALRVRAVEGLARWAAASRDRPRDLLDHVDAGAQLLEFAAGTAPEAGARLALALDGALATSGLWDTWQHVLEQGVLCAEQAEDLGQASYLRHQLGMVALAHRDAERATELLRVALAERQLLGDAAGVDRTKRALEHTTALHTVDERSDVSLPVSGTPEARSMPLPPSGERDEGTETARSPVAVKPPPGWSGGERGRGSVDRSLGGGRGDFLDRGRRDPPRPVGARAEREPGPSRSQWQEPPDAPPARSRPSVPRFLAQPLWIAAVAGIEAVSIYGWLRSRAGDEPWWGLLALIVGMVVETGVRRRHLAHVGVRRWGPMPQGADRNHLRRLGFAVFPATVIWVLWLVCAYELSQPIAAAALLVALHVQHQIEIATVRDVSFRTGLFSVTGVCASAMKVAGAVAGLALILDGHTVLAGVALGVGLFVGHALLSDVLRSEITARDIRLPRDTRWRAPIRSRPALAYAASHFAVFWRAVQRIAPLARLVNRVAINSLIARVEPRPTPLDTIAPYTSRTSLTDRLYSSRYLPPAASNLSPIQGPPTSADVASSFMRDEMLESPKSTVLFSFFAQWFTEAILRTERDDAQTVRDIQRNESNHEIDLAQLYGFDRDATDQLRTGRGLLKSQIIDGEEYPPYYYRPGPDGELQPDPEFNRLPAPLLLERLTYEQKRTLFAMGSDTRNVGFIALNVLFLREHNRIARRLDDEYPDWDSDRVFETTRYILTVVLLKIIVEEYINHISPALFRLRLVPGNFPNEPWFRPNRVAIEFNLLYRWHCLVPSTFHLGGRHLAIPEMLSDTGVLTSAGLGQFLAAASHEPAGRMSLFNTDPFLVAVAETPSIEQARAAELASYNDYRRLCRQPPRASFAEISSDPEIQQQLAALYPGGVEDVEFYVGLFAEDLGPNDVLPPLMMTMVAFYTLSLAFTNPLLAPRVFDEATFSAVGMEIIENTSRLADLVERNVPRQSEPYFVSMTRRDYKRI